MGNNGKYEQKEIHRLYNLVESIEETHCILHHTDKLVPENELRDMVRICRNKKIKSSQLDRYLRTLSNAGILHCFIVPESDMLHYKISPLGKKIKNEIKITGSKYDHPYK